MREWIVNGFSIGFCRDACILNSLPGFETMRIFAGKTVRHLKNKRAATVLDSYGLISLPCVLAATQHMPKSKRRLVLLDKYFLNKTNTPSLAYMSIGTKVNVLRADMLFLKRIACIHLFL